MNQIHAEASAVIEARPEKVYAILSDYRVSHPAILPKQYFTEVAVEQGGQGAGTIVRAHMTGDGYRDELSLDCQRATAGPRADGNGRRAGGNHDLYG